jgi:hypothetical protein
MSVMKTALWIVPLTMVLSHCGGDDAAELSEPSPPHVAANTLVVGSGDSCRTDLDCGVARPHGGCMLGTCVGLLTTESQAVRVTLARRLMTADSAVRDEVIERLQAVIGSKQAGRTARLGAIEALGRIVIGDKGCGALCQALRAAATDSDEQVAIMARLALARRGDDSVRGQLIEDAQLGTEYLRCAAAEALGHYLDHQRSDEVIEGLASLLDDSAWSVRMAALRSLLMARDREQVQVAIKRLERRGDVAVHYLLERDRSSALSAKSPRGLP